MSETIPVGSRWRDNDKRMTRTVVVERVAGDYVWYRGEVASRSFIPRFLKAFTRIDIPQPTPRDSREAVIEKKLSEILLGMDHATGDRDLQIWIATEGINEALALLKEKARPLMVEVHRWGRHGGMGV